MKAKLLQTLGLPLRKTTERTRNPGLPSSIVHRGSQFEVIWGLQTQVEDTEKYIFSWLTGGSNEPSLLGNFFSKSEKMIAIRIHRAPQTESVQVRAKWALDVLH